MYHSIDLDPFLHCNRPNANRELASESACRQQCISLLRSGGVTESQLQNGLGWKDRDEHN